MQRYAQEISWGYKSQYWLFYGTESKKKNPFCQSSEKT